MRHVLKLLWYICIIGKLGLVGAKAELHIIPDKVWGVCPEFKNAPVKLTDFHVRNPSGRSDEVTFSMHVARNVGDNIRLKIEVKTCQSKERLDTCTPFVNLNTKLLCKFLEDRSTIFGPFVDCVKPQLKCPIAKGVYRGENCTLNWKNFRMLPISVLSIGYYIVRLECIKDATKENLACFRGHGTLRKIYVEPQV